MNKNEQTVVGPLWRPHKHAHACCYCMYAHTYAGAHKHTPVIGLGLRSSLQLTCPLRVPAGRLIGLRVANQMRDKVWTCMHNARQHVMNENGGGNDTADGSTLRRERVTRPCGINSYQERYRKYLLQGSSSYSTKGNITAHFKRLLSVEFVG
uniref:Uncharacterized protein n=1 Tax=Echinococcus canadensis TaxID=519352 RepID=A0A915EUG1_9CEST